MDENSSLVVKNVLLNLSLWLIAKTTLISFCSFLDSVCII